MPDSIKSYHEERVDKTCRKLHDIFKETEELIAIIAKSKETAKHNKTANKLNIEN